MDIYVRDEKKSSEAKNVAQGHTASKWYSQGLNPSHLALESTV